MKARCHVKLQHLGPSAPVAKAICSQTIFLTKMGHSWTTTCAL